MWPQETVREVGIEPETVALQQSSHHIPLYNIRKTDIYSIKLYLIKRWKGVADLVGIGAFSLPVPCALGWVDVGAKANLRWIFVELYGNIFQINQKKSSGVKWP
jgi:hypothetical protein